MRTFQGAASMRSFPLSAEIISESDSEEESSDREKQSSSSMVEYTFIPSQDDMGLTENLKPSLKTSQKNPPPLNEVHSAKSSIQKSKSPNQMAEQVQQDACQGQADDRRSAPLVIEYSSLLHMEINSKI